MRRKTQIEAESRERFTSHNMIQATANVFPPEGCLRHVEALQRNDAALQDKLEVA
jgi:hypothetical protein